MSSSKARPKVFISYSHDSPEHKERVLEFSDRLRKDGVDATIDRYEVSPAEGLPAWMATQIRNSDFVIAVCTATYLRRVEGREEPAKAPALPCKNLPPTPPTHYPASTTKQYTHQHL